MDQLQPYTTIAAPICILAFLLITFLQSGIDKVVDWQGNVSWLKAHFSKTFMGGMIPFLLTVILVAEIITAVVCILGIYQIIASGVLLFAFYGCLLSCITLLILLFGQRVAKDYAGALTITCYFIVAVFGLYILDVY